MPHIFPTKYPTLACKIWVSEAILGGRSWGLVQRWAKDDADEHTSAGRSVCRLPTTSGGIAVAPPAGHVSLEGVHGSVKLPEHEAGFWQHWWAFSGPAILVSVGYMDPGNWGTDLQAGASTSSGCCGSWAWPA